MGRLRPYAPAALAAVLQIVLFSRLRLWGLCPPLVPGAVFLPWVLALYAALGGLAGAWTASPAGFFGLWLRFVPLAAAMEGLLVALHWPARSALAAAWAIAGPELALTLLCFPLAALLPGLFRRRRVRPRY